MVGTFMSVFRSVSHYEKKKGWIFPEILEKDE